MRAKYIGHAPTVRIGELQVQPGETVGHGGTHEIPDRDVQALAARADFKLIDDSPAPVPPPADEPEPVTAETRVPSVPPRAVTRGPPLPVDPDALPPSDRGKGA